MNCILVVIDSLDYTRFQKSNINLLPFLSDISRDGLVCENIYSQAPYTEAAAMALYCGQNTLSNHGYMERYNNAPKTIFEVMSENGYDVYFNALQPQCYPSSLRRGINNIRYNRAFDFIGFWNYRLDYYSKIYLNEGLNEKDYLQLIRLFDDNFIEWIKFFDDLINNDVSVRMIKSRNLNYNALKEKEKLLNEISAYQKNKKEYINGVLKQTKVHTIFAIEPFTQIDFSFTDELKKTFETKGKFLKKRIRRKNFFSNILFNSDIYREALNAIRSYIKENDKSTIRLIKNVLFAPWVKDGAGEKFSRIKEQPGFRTHINDFLQWLDEKDDDNAYFACIHVDDIHYPETFFSYDSNDVNLLLEEYRMAESHLKERKLSNYGAISTDLSLLYADFHCKYLVDEMKKRGKYEDTIFFVTADHGFSYAGYPIRNKPINTFFMENFKIPFFAFGDKIPPDLNKGLHSSVDIPATICSCMGISPGEAFNGNNVFTSERDSLLLEYCGGGCPDLLRREIMLACMDKERMIAIKIKLENEFDLNSVTEVYDLKKDPMQKKNLVKDYCIEEYTDLINNLKERFEQIVLDEKKFWKKIEEDKQ